MHSWTIVSYRKCGEPWDTANSEGSLADDKTRDDGDVFESYQFEVVDKEVEMELGRAQFADKSNR